MSPRLLRLEGAAALNQVLVLHLRARRRLRKPAEKWRTCWGGASAQGGLAADVYSERATLESGVSAGAGTRAAVDGVAWCRLTPGAPQKEVPGSAPVRDPAPLRPEPMAPATKPDPRAPHYEQIAATGAEEPAEEPAKNPGQTTVSARGERFCASRASATDHDTDRRAQADGQPGGTNGVLLTNCSRTKASVLGSWARAWIRTRVDSTRSRASAARRA
jgi:hypothetical protein